MKFLLALLLVALLSGCTDAGTDADAGSDPMEETPTEPSGNDPTDPGNNTTIQGSEVSLSIAAIRDSPIATHAFDKDTLEVNVGDIVSLTFTNDDTHPLFANHDFYIEALDLGTSVIGTGEQDSLIFTVDLEPGEYVFYCTVGNHRADGMEGMLIVS